MAEKSPSCRVNKAGPEGLGLNLWWGGAAAAWQPGFRSFLGMLLQPCYSGEAALRAWIFTTFHPLLVLGWRLGRGPCAIKIKRQSVSCSSKGRIPSSTEVSEGHFTVQSQAGRGCWVSECLRAHGLQHQASLWRCTQLDRMLELLNVRIHSFKGSCFSHA